MSNIGIRNNWGYFDRIEGDSSDLADGDLLVLRWPNGVRQVVRVEVRSTVLDERDSTRRTEAFAETIAQGAIVRVALQPIPGLEVERVPSGTPLTLLGDLL